MSLKSGGNSPIALHGQSQGTQVYEKKASAKHGKSQRKYAPCPWLCNPVPVSVPGPGEAQAVLHPKKDVFVLKVAKVGANGDRRSKMELELVTPKGPEMEPPGRLDTRETQCDPEPSCACCGGKTGKKSRGKKLAVM